MYLHIQASDEGWEYTLYTKRDMAQLDGGLLDSPGLSIADVVEHIRKTEKIGTLAVDLAPIEVLDELRDRSDCALEAAVGSIQPEQGRDYAGELREHFAREDAALWDTTLDEYPMPDSTMTLDDLAGLGYEETDLLPLSRDRGAELADRDMTVYMVRTGEDPEMVFDREDLMEQPEGVMFAIPREEWEKCPDFRQAVADRMNHQGDREQAFLNHAGDCFAIYQVSREDPQNAHFMGMDWLKSHGLSPERSSYDLAYTAPLPAAASAGVALEALFEKFNIDHPADYLRPSMSVSDIVAIRRDGVLSCHYCDSVGFQQLPDFIKPENYLKNAEMSMEDDFGMIDGIINNGPKEPTVAELEQQARSGQPISLTDLAGAVHRERGERKSVLEKLNAKPPQQERKKTAPKKSAERER